MTQQLKKVKVEIIALKEDNVWTTTGNAFYLVYVILQKNVNQKILQRIYLHFDYFKELSLISIGKQFFCSKLHM